MEVQKIEERRNSTNKRIFLFGLIQHDYRFPFHHFVLLVEVVLSLPVIHSERRKLKQDQVRAYGE